MIPRKQPESDIYKSVAQYLIQTYPHLFWRFDFAAGTKLGRKQASQHRAMNPHKGYPDLFIAQPIGTKHGLFIEIKRSDKTPFKSNGQIKSDEHLIQQESVLKDLRMIGYSATFAVGYQDVIDKIELYLSGKL